VPGDDQEVGEAVRGGRGSRACGSATIPPRPEAQDSPCGEGEDRRGKARSSAVRDPADRADASACAVPAREQGDSTADAAREEAPGQEAPQSEAEAPLAAVLRAVDPQPAVAERHLLLPPRRQERLPDRLH